MNGSSKGLTPQPPFHTNFFPQRLSTPTMSRQVLGKRPRSNSRLSLSPSRSPTPSYKTRRITRELPSPDPTPNPKRVKASSTKLEYNDGDSNKENIPPHIISCSLTSPIASANSSSLSSTSDATTSASTMTPRALRASRRASTQAPPNTPGESEFTRLGKTHLRLASFSST